MTILTSKTAIILAAGLGTRLKPITNHTPKPLVIVNKRPLLDYTIDRLVQNGIKKLIINIHHLGNKIKQHVSDRKDIKIVLSDETKMLLETGGGIKNALNIIGKRPFYAVNGDVIWIDGPRSATSRLAGFWNEQNMDMLLLLHPRKTAVGYSGPGDFTLNSSGNIQRRHMNTNAPYVFSGVQIIHPRIFNDSPEAPFSLNTLYDQAIEKKRLFGLIHDGEWIHIGNNSELNQAQNFLTNYPQNF